MKRVIKYHNPYVNDKHEFSDCSTNYEILPILIADDAGGTELKKLALSLGLKWKGDAIASEKERYRSRDGLKITHALKIGQVTQERWGKKETYPEYLGFITLPSDTETLPLKESINNKVDKFQAYDIIDTQVYGVSSAGETVDEERVLVKSGWQYEHCIPLLGYSLESFEKVAGITETGFDDDTYSCDNCGKYDSRDNGYTYNFREFDGSNLGVNCGCYDEACAKGYMSFADDSDRAMQLETAEALEKKGKLKFVERFIGGMVDGRGGYYGGQRTREGRPDKVLAELKAANPKKKYLFTHDESGQFQTYFSVWEIGNFKKPKAKASKRVKETA